MADQNVLEGRKWRINRWTGSAFAFFCLAVDLDLDRSHEFEDVTVNDCDVPSAAARQKSTIRLKKAQVDVKGAVDALKLQVLEQDYDNGTRQQYQCIMDETGANGGQTYSFFAYVEQLKIGKQNGGAVKFECKLRVDGTVTRAALA